MDKEKETKKKEGSATASFFMTILVVICVSVFIKLMYVFWPYSMAVLCGCFIFIMLWTGVHQMMYGDPLPPESI